VGVLKRQFLVLKKIKEQIFKAKMQRFQVAREDYMHEQLIMFVSLYFSLAFFAR